MKYLRVILNTFTKRRIGSSAVSSHLRAEMLQRKRRRDLLGSCICCSCARVRHSTHMIFSIAYDTSVQIYCRNFRKRILQNAKLERSGET